MNIFIDCGFYIGDALKKYVQDGVVDESWLVYAFEPNPDIDVDEAVKAFPFKIDVVKKAVWTKAGRAAFWTSNRHNAAHLDGMPEHAEKERIVVKTIDFSRFLSKIPETAYVICSMDIEGAEFPVLRKCLEDSTIDRVDILDIEFHHRFMVDETASSAADIIDDLEDRGVQVKLKVDLT